MTSKNLFFNLMREDLKRRLWAAALTFLLFFFSLPVASALVLSENRRLVNEAYAGLLYSIRGIVGLQNGFLGVFIGILSIVLGVTSFSWLHSRKKVDFYHSIPVRREKLFFVNYLDGILIPFAAYGVNLILTVLVAALNGIAAGDVLPTALGAFVFLLLHYTMLYSVTVLAMMMTGHVLVGILGTGVFHLYFPTLLLIFAAFNQEFLKTSYNGSGNLISLLMDKCSAFTLYITNYSVMMNEPLSGAMMLRLVVVAAAAAVLTAASLILYRMRGSEAAGKAMAFGLSKPVIRIPIVILSSLGGGLFFWYLRHSIGWVIFGILCGMVLSHCVIEIIYHFDFKKLFTNRISMAVCAVAAALIFSAFRFDLFQYDQYIPDQSKLQSMAISMSNMDYWVSYGKTAEDEEGNYSWDYESSDEHIFSRMNLTGTEMDTALALVKEAISQIQKEKETGTAAWEYSDGGRYTSFSVIYRLKNGKEVKRSYGVYGSRAYELVKEVYSTTEYRRAAYPLMEQTPEGTAKIRVSEEGWTKEVTRGDEGEADYVERILNAYQEEFMALTPETMENENPVATIQFMTPEQKAAEDKKRAESSSWRYDNILNKGYYPLYPSFANTINLLKDCGIEVNQEVAVSEIREAVVDLHSLVDLEDLDYSTEDADIVYEKAVYDTAYPEEDQSVYTVTDAGEIGELMAHAIPEGDTSLNPFWAGENRISFEVVISGKSGRYSRQYTIAKSDVPEFLKAAAARFRKFAG